MAGRGRLYDEIDLTTERLVVDGKPMPDGVTLDDWMRLHFAFAFYNWLNSIRGCRHGQSWRLDSEHGWCGV